MAAPQTTPDLSVVSPESKPAAGTPVAVPSSGESREQRHRVPLWLLLVAVVAGAVLWFMQYQRAELLDARVTSLSEELKTAGEQLTAYQGHLESVRSGVGDLSAQMANLKALVDRDPLAPAVQEGSTPAAAGEAEAATKAPGAGQPVIEAETLSVAPSGGVDIAEAISDANAGAQAAASLSVDDGRAQSDLVDGALAAPFAVSEGAAAGAVDSR